VLLFTNAGMHISRFHFSSCTWDKQSDWILLTLAYLVSDTFDVCIFYFLPKVYGNALGCVLLNFLKVVQMWSELHL